MRNSILNYITIIVALILLADCSSKDTEIAEPSSIYGVVSDKATGEPVSSAGVSLSPTGAKTVTGSEGQYEFAELEAGDYKINVTKTGYKDLINWAINVREGKTNKGDVQIEKLPAVLRVTNSNGVDIDTLDLGSSAGVTTANFNIFNDGVVVLEWSIVESSDWITALSETEGTLESGKTQGIIITIDRSKLLSGVNVTKLNINSNYGSKEITVVAMDTRPLVSVENATNVSTTTATLNGTILFAGTPMYTERGFVYDTLSTPTLATTQKKVSLTSTAGDSYSAGITNLNQGTKYYVRAYAVNVSGTSYSTNEVDFTTQVLLPTLTTQAATDKNVAAGTATFNGTILTVGDPAYTERGFVYATTANPTTNDTKRTVAGTGVGTFNADIDELTEGSVYHIRAYAVNMAGTAYGNDTTLNFVITMPTVSTQNITNQSIATGTATFNGTLVSVGDLPVTERGFVFATTANPTLDNTKVVVSGTGTGAFNANVTEGLTEGSTYYVRAYATNSKGTVYGEGISFAFIATLPTVSTQAVTNKNIAAGTATFNGTILTVGDPAYTERGFVYGTSNNPTTGATKITVSGSTAGTFSANATGISEGATYYVRAYATNSNSTVYGEEVSVDFNAVMPTVSTQAVTGITLTTATLNGTILTVGDLSITERGFVYATTANPTLDNTKVVVSGTGTGAFNANVTGLTEGSTYHVRAYAINSKGTVYGEEVSFTPNNSNNVVVLTESNLMVHSEDISENSEPWRTANSLCGNSTLDGYTDWRLPTQDELNIMYIERNTIGNFVTSNDNDPWYWSSTATYSVGVNDYYWVLNFSSGVQNSTSNYTSRCRCVRYIIDFDANMPTVSTQAVTNQSISNGTAVFNGTILIVGIPAYTERGFVYATTTNPTLDNTKVVVSGTGTGAFNANVTGLTEGSTYYVRAYATNSTGTVYGEEITFTFIATMPTVSTQEATNKNIATGTATFNGTILTVGDPAYTERGLVYATTVNPTLDDSTIVVSGTGTGVFNATVTGLTEGNVYHVRAYATNSKGTVYGNEVSLDFNAVMPTVSTQAVTNRNISAGTATFNGTIITVGDPAYTERGFVYGTSHNPIVDSTKITVSGSTAGTFSSVVTGFTEGNIYYVRAYAVNSKGTVYGEEVSVDFNAVMPTVSTQAVTNRNISAGTATFNGTILTLGDLAYTERGFVYATIANPTLDDSTIVVSGTGTGVFNSNVTGLTEGSTYHVRAYATNSKGTVYGNEVSLDFNAVMPTLITQAVTDVNISAGTATFRGTILTVGDPAYTERGFVYGTSHNPTVDSTKITVPGNTEGMFSANATGIAEGVTYYVRAYATNSKGTVYGKEVNMNFTAVMPTVSTQAVTNKSIANGTATFNGTIESVGDLTITERGFVYVVYTIEGSPSASIKVIVDGTGTGTFKADITGLVESNDTYYIRAYATNSKGTVYGEEISMDFQAVMPTLSTQEVTNKNVVNGTATFNGTIESVGDPAITERGFVYVPAGYSFYDNTKTKKVIVDGTVIGTFKADVTGLENNTYYISSYATNSKGSTVYGYGVILDFTVVMPTISTQAVTDKNIANGTATFNGTILTAGNMPITERGFVYATTANPTLDNTTVIAYGTEIGDFDANVTGLESNNTYYVKAYATNSKGSTVYGNEVWLDFSANPNPPTVNMVSAKTVSGQHNSVTFVGSIMEGDLSITERGFVWSTSHSPTIETAFSQKVSGTAGQYSVIAADVAIDLTWYVRAYAKTGETVTYSAELTYSMLEMVEVQGGTFTMGCVNDGECESDERPAHTVTLSSFSMGKYEVTQGLWKAVMGSNPSIFKGDNLPVEYVSWDDCQTFITKLNAATGKNYRLPTEAEWEYAARGGNRSNGYKYSGSNNVDDVAWYGYSESTGGSTHPVGTKKPNELGIYDMSGNVEEWCSDWYGNYTTSPKTDPTGPGSGSHRVFRGEAWDGYAVYCRVANRDGYIPDILDSSMGFRLVLP